MVTLRYIAILCLLFCVSGCATIRKFNPISSHTLEARRMTQEAEAAMHQSLWEEAETKLITAIERCPEDNHARAVLADVLWQRGAHNAAVEQKSRSITLSGRRDHVELTELGQMQLSVGNLQQALRHADEAIAIDSSYANAWTLRGFVLQAQENPDEALSSFFRSLSIRTDDPRTRLEIAKIYHQTAQPQRALAILGAAPQEAIASCPYVSDVCYLRGILMRELDRPVDAIAALQSAREHDCEEKDLLLHLADAQLAAGEQLQARATLADAANSTGPEFEVAIRDLQNRIESGQPATTIWR